MDAPLLDENGLPVEVPLEEEARYQADMVHRWLYGRPVPELGLIEPVGLVCENRQAVYQRTRDEWVVAEEDGFRTFYIGPNLPRVLLALTAAYTERRHASVTDGKFLRPPDRSLMSYWREMRALSEYEP